MTTIYLIRHAQSLANAGGTSLPDQQIPLSPLGLQQAESLIRKLPRASQIFTSEFLRTQQTAMPFAQYWQQDFQPLHLLNEFSYLPFDLIEGLNAEQRRPISQAYWLRNNPKEQLGSQTDSFALFSQRIETFLQYAKNLPDNSVCFTHGIWIALL